jgi:hypothetical protein
MIKRFDLVRILSIDRVNWLSGPKGRPATPDGIWSVVAGVGNDVLISKDETVVKIPKGDIALLAQFDNDKMFSALTTVKTAEDVVKYMKGKDKHGTGEEGREGPSKNNSRIVV